MNGLLAKLPDVKLDRPLNAHLSAPRNMQTSFKSRVRIEPSSRLSEEDTLCVSSNEEGGSSLSPQPQTLKAERIRPCEPLLLCIKGTSLLVWVLSLNKRLDYFHAIDASWNEDPSHVRITRLNWLSRSDPRSFTSLFQRQLPR